MKQCNQSKNYLEEKKKMSRRYIKIALFYLKKERNFITLDKNNIASQQHCAWLDFAFSF